MEWENLKRAILERKILKKDNSEQEKSEKRHFWKEKNKKKGEQFQKGRI